MLAVITTIVVGASLVIGGICKCSDRAQAEKLAIRGHQLNEDCERYVRLWTDEFPHLEEYIVNGQLPIFSKSPGKWVDDVYKRRYMNEKRNIEGYAELREKARVGIIYSTIDGMTREEIEAYDFRNVVDWSWECVKEVAMNKERTIYRYHFTMRDDEARRKGLPDPVFTYDEYLANCMKASGLMIRNKSLLVFDDHPELREQVKFIIARYGHFTKSPDWRKTD